MDGEYVEPTSLVVKEIVNLADGKQVVGNTSLERSATGSYELNLREFITEAGIYQIAVDLELGEEAAGIKREIRAMAPLPEVKAVLFDFNKRQGVSKIPESERTRLAYSKKSKQVKISLTGVREGRLEVTVKGTKPEHVHARFQYLGSCDIWQTCSFNVVGTPKSRKYVWKIDLAKEPYSNAFMDGRYKITALVSGPLMNANVEWDLGTVEFTLPVEDSEADYEPINDRNVYFHQREPIFHTFAPPPAQANSFLALLFTGIIMTPLFIFLLFREKLIGSVEYTVSANGMLYQASMLVVA